MHQMLWIINIWAALRLLCLSSYPLNYWRGCRWKHEEKKLLKCNFWLGTKDKMQLNVTVFHLLRHKYFSRAPTQAARVKPLILAASQWFIHGTCVIVLNAIVSCYYTFVPSVMRKYNPNTWSEGGSDTVGCHYHLNLSGFTTEPLV